MSAIDRRQFLASAAALSAAPLVVTRAAAAETTLVAETRVLDIDGRAASVYRIGKSGGDQGLFLDPGQRFALQLENRLPEPTLIHWHGQTPPFGQDGVPGLPEPALSPGQSKTYDFAARPGTHWMHSHEGLQEMSLLAAPLIVRRPAEKLADRQEVVIFLHDFSFRAPAEILAGLTKGAMSGHAGHGGHNPHAGHQMPAGMAPSMDLNDVDFDAYLANDRTLSDPSVVKVERGGRVRLRVINGAAATVFLLDLGALKGRLVAVDGNPVAPLDGRRFALSMGQRVDIEIDLPRSAKAWPILARREGDRRQTGIILAAPGAAVAKVDAMAADPAGAMDLTLETKLRAVDTLPPRPVSRQLRATLTGDMARYVWGIDGKTWPEVSPLTVVSGERVELTMINQTEMAHPMHLHGHHFQIVAIGRQRFSGALRDTVHLPPNTSVTVAFDANNPGRWLFHCHNLLHMAAGMMTEVAYQS